MLLLLPYGKVGTKRCRSVVHTTKTNKQTKTRRKNPRKKGRMKQHSHIVGEHGTHDARERDRGAALGALAQRHERGMKDRFGAAKQAKFREALLRGVKTTLNRYLAKTRSHRPSVVAAMPMAGPLTRATRGSGWWINACTYRCSTPAAWAAKALGSLADAKMVKSFPLAPKKHTRTNVSK